MYVHISKYETWLEIFMKHFCDYVSLTVQFVKIRVDMAKLRLSKLFLGKV